MKDRTQKICGRLVRDGNTAAGCSSMGGHHGRGNYCGNLLWQLSLTLLFLLFQ